MLIDVEDLNTKKGQDTIFDFIGVKRLKGEMICREGESRLKKGLAFLVK